MATAMGENTVSVQRPVDNQACYIELRIWDGHQMLLESRDVLDVYQHWAFDLRIDCTDRGRDRQGATAAYGRH